MLKTGDPIPGMRGARWRGGGAQLAPDGTLGLFGAATSTSGDFDVVLAGREVLRAVAWSGMALGGGRRLGPLSGPRGVFRAGASAEGVALLAQLIGDTSGRAEGLGLWVASATTAHLRPVALHLFGGREPLPDAPGYWRNDLGTDLRDRDEWSVISPGGFSALFSTGKKRSDEVTPIEAVYRAGWWGGEPTLLWSAGADGWVRRWSADGLTINRDAEIAFSGSVTKHDGTNEAGVFVLAATDSYVLAGSRGECTGVDAFVLLTSSRVVGRGPDGCLWKDLGHGTFAIAKVGDRAPGLDDRTTIQQIEAFAGTDVGGIAFVAVLSDGGRALFAGDNTGLELVVRTGVDVELWHRGARLVRRVRGIHLPVRHAGGSNGHPRFFNDRGELVFTLDFDGAEARSGLIVASEGMIVNSAADTADADHGDGHCDTGGPRVEGRRECTLRAAIEEANAWPGRDRIEFDIPGAAVLTPQRPLPTIEEGVFLDATTQSGGRVVLEGDGAGPDAAGLRLDAGRSSIAGLTIRRFSGAGIVSTSVAGIQVADLRLLDNCGWGIEARATVTVGEVDGALTQISGNGRSDTCRAGGVLHRAVGEQASLTIFNADVDDNDGPGVLSTGEPRLAQMRVRRNRGQGIAAVGMGGDQVPVDFWKLGGANEVSDNLGHGVHAMFRGVSIQRTTRIERNGGWGIYADDAVEIAGVRPQAVVATRDNHVSNNGVGVECYEWYFEMDAPMRRPIGCGGGGVFTSHEGDPSLLFFTDLVDNAGPGVLSQEAVWLGGGTISGNRGSGVAVISPEDSVIVTLAPMSITNNRGHGVYTLEGGGFSSDATVDISDNGQWGVYVAGRVVISGPTPQHVSSASDNRVSGNGRPGTCYDWDIVGGDPVVTTVDCGPAGGVFSDHMTAVGEPNYLHLAEVANNHGPGVLARSEFHLGDVRITGKRGAGVEISHACGPVELRGAMGLNVITDNAGAGILSFEGGVLMVQKTLINGNGAWGIHTGGSFHLGAPTPQGWLAGGGTQISNNGHGAACWEWTNDRGPPAPTAVPCEGGGAWSDDPIGQSWLHFGEVRGNAGDGLRALNDLLVTTSTVCGNDGDQWSAGGELILEDVNQGC